MKTLFFCNTNYQLIVAMQIAVTFDKKCSVIITNQIQNADSVLENVKNTHLFENVSFIDVKATVPSSEMMKKCVYGFAPAEIINCIFDEFVGFNMDIYSHMVYAFFYNQNKKILINKMEEGLMSLNTTETSCRVLDWTYKIRKLMRKKNLRESISGFYCFLPQANKTDIPSIQIPMIKETSEIRDYLNNVFCQNASFAYKEKYIFLPCIYDIEGGEPIGELELAKKIANKVGKENLIVKVHPRDNKEKYIDAGLKVDENSLVPFEVIQINNDFSEKILITTLSTSILNFNPVLEKVSKSYYGYKLCDLSENPLAQHYKKVLEEYLNDKNLGLRNIHVLDTIEEI